MRATHDVLGLTLADLDLWLDARESGVQLVLPAGYAQFVARRAPGGGLTLQVRDGPLSGTEGWRSLFYYHAETWQLWLDGAGRRVFVASKRSPPPRQIAVDTAFRSGEVVGGFSRDVRAREALYPLKHIDTAIFVNWLACFGDLIVHAASIDDEGAGYAFVGPSGAGKSTLAAELVSGSSVTVLGEDSVIVRCQEGRFVLYGTPWHTNPARCSPGGVPLKKLFFLERGGGHGVEPCGRTAGIGRVLQNAFVPFYDRAAVERILEGLSRLAEQVPFYVLSYRLGEDVMALIRDA